MKKNKASFWRLLYKLHRYIGLLSALVLLMLAVTGIILNHSEDLELDSQFIQSSPVLDWYGIKSPDNILSFKTSRYTLSQLGNKLYLQQQLIFNSATKLLGIIETKDYLVAAFSKSLWLLSLEGEVIEQIPMSAIIKIGTDKHQRVFIQQAQAILYSDDDLLSWKPSSEDKKIVSWSQKIVLPETIKQTLQNDFRGAILPLERVLLDVHSGRFFGKIGVIVVDIAGVLLIILTMSGCLIWFKHKLRSRKKRKN